MKLSKITEPGFYWNRLDEHRDWTVVYVRRNAKHPSHPFYNTWIIDGQILPVAGGLNARPALSGEFVGPITPPVR